MAGHRFLTEVQGGVELQTRYIGEVLARSGWKSVYLAPTLGRKTGREETGPDLSVWWYPNFSYSFQAPRARIEAILDDVKPSVFYQRGRGQLLESGVILRYARKKSIPLVFALSSDTDLETFHATRSHLAAYRPGWKKILALPLALASDRARREILKRADRVVVQHEGQMQALRKTYWRNAVLLRTVHPELNRAVRKGKQKTVLWVSNYRPLKQGALFVDLAGACTSLDCHFVMVYGRTKREYLGAFLDKARVRTNLTVNGELPPHEAERLMEEAALLVNTSLPVEGFPNTFVQSWLRETPTLSLHVDPGGITAREGIGICSGSFERLVMDTIRLLENDGERLGMGKRARWYAERYHGLEHNTARIVAFFEGLVAGKGTSP